MKQASNEWNKEIDRTIQSFGFNQCKSDNCVCWKRSGTDELIILALFVDDIVIIHSANDNNEWKQLKAKFMAKYKMTDNKNAQFILGMKLERASDSLTITQELQINKVLKQFNMEDCKMKSTPSEVLKLTAADCPTTEQDKSAMQSVPYMSMVGSMMYISLCNRPDIAYCANSVSRFSQNPGERHWIACKRILRYLKGTATLGLKYYKNQPTDRIELAGYCDADWAGDVDDRKSTTGFVIRINECTVHWGSKKQSTVALSSAEAEYMGICTAATELKWFRNLLNELNLVTDEIPILYCGNQSAIAISENDKLHNRTKHIDIRHHFVREMVKTKQIKLKWIESGKQLADILTKNLSVKQFKELRVKLMNDGGII